MPTWCKMHSFLTSATTSYTERWATLKKDMNPYLLSIIGLSLDIIGVVLLFKFGLPSKIIDGYAIGETFKGKDKSEQDRKNWKIRFGARSGLAFLIFGFILQLFSSIVQYCN